MTPRRLAWIAAAAAAFLASIPAAGRDGEGDKPPPAPPPAPGPGDPADAGKRYGEVPADVEPWKGVGEPLQRWFREKMEFRGAGRDDPEPPDPAKVKIGLLAPLEGHPDAPLGIAMRDGMLLAAEEANRAGGWRGVPFELVVRNDLPLWGASSNRIVELAYDEDVRAILGSVEGNSTHILLRVALKIEIPIVNTADTDPTLNETNIPWLVRVIPDDRQECYRLFRHARGERGLRRMVVLRSGERYGRIQSGEFIDSMRRAGSPVLADLRWARGGAVPEGVLDRVRDLRPDGVLLWGNGDEMGRVVKALRAAGLAVPILGPDRMVSEAFLREAGEAAEGCVAACHFDPGRDDPRWKGFRERFRARHGREPDAYAAYGYDGANLLFEAIRAAGLNRVRIRDRLYAIDSWDGAVTGPVRFDAARSNVRPSLLALRRGGAWVYHE